MAEENNISQMTEMRPSGQEQTQQALIFLDCFNYGSLILVESSSIFLSSVHSHK